MNPFWFYAWSLCFVSLTFVLIPLMRTYKNNDEINRADVNTKLYIDRLRELETLHETGLLTSEQLEAGEAELARELLQDAYISDLPSINSLGRPLPILVSLSLPFVAVFLYTQWGAQDQILASQNQQTQSRQGTEKTIAHLETLLKENPDSGEGWTLLGRAYMQDDRLNDALRAFEKAASIDGRSPELLGRQAQAMYFSGGRRWTPQLQSMIEEALTSNPLEPICLKLAGAAAFEEGRFEDAEMYWERLLAVLPEINSSRASVAADIKKAHQLAMK